MSMSNFANGNSETLSCVAYGDHLTYENRSEAVARLTAKGWAVVEWAVDNREALARPLPERPGAVRALARGVALGLPIVVPDHLDLRSRAEAMKYAAAGAWLGVDVHTLAGRVLDERGCSDEMDFALLTLLREVEATRDAALTAVADVAPEPVALAWSASDGGQQPPAPPNAQSAASGTDDDGHPGEHAVVQELRPYVARYWRFVETRLDLYKSAPPPLPEQSQPWPERRLSIGRVARSLATGGWCDVEIARLLNETGVRTPQGGQWYAQRVNYYRRTYGRGAA